MSDDPIPGLDSPPPASPFRMDITPIRTNQVNLFFSPANEDDEQPLPRRSAEPPQAYTRRSGGSPQVYTRKARTIVEDDDNDEDEEPAPPSKRQRSDRAPTNAAARLAASRRPADGQTSALSLFDDDDIRPGATQGQMETFDPLLGPVGMMNGRSGEGDEDGDTTGKRKRVIPKFNAERLLSDRGLPALVKDAKKFRVSGKGHEAKDLANLLSTYQMWAHQLFPKMPFSETVARIETLCHTNLVKSALRGYKERDRELREALFRSPTPPPIADTTDPTTSTAERVAGVTVPADDLPNGEIDMPDDEEDYEGMIAAAEAEAAEAQRTRPTAPTKPTYGNDEEDEDDFEAMIAAAEAEVAEAHAVDLPMKVVEKSVPEVGDEYDDDWAAMDGM